MLIKKPGGYVCFQISHNFAERQILNGRHLCFKEYVILCILPLKIFFLLDSASK